LPSTKEVPVPQTAALSDVMSTTETHLPSTKEVPVPQTAALSDVMSTTETACVV